MNGIIIIIISYLIVFHNYLIIYQTINMDFFDFIMNALMRIIIIIIITEIPDASNNIVLGVIIHVFIGYFLDFT